MSSSQGFAASKPTDAGEEYSDDDEDDSADIAFDDQSTVASSTVSGTSTQVVVLNHAPKLDPSLRQQIHKPPKQKIKLNPEFAKLVFLRSVSFKDFEDAKSEPFP